MWSEVGERKEVCVRVVAVQSSVHRRAQHRGPKRARGRVVARRAWCRSCMDAIRMGTDTRETISLDGYRRSILAHSSCPCWSATCGQRGRACHSDDAYPNHSHDPLARAPSNQSAPMLTCSGVLCCALRVSGVAAVCGHMCMRITHVMPPTMHPPRHYLKQ